MNNSENQNFIRQYLKSIIWALIILYLSLFNINDNETLKELLFPYSDKIAHLGVYGIFTLLLLKDHTKKGKQLLPLIIPILYGILMEFLQYSLTEYRSMEMLDILANTIGALSAWLIYRKIINPAPL